MIVNKDNLALNECIIGFEEKLLALETALDSGSDNAVDDAITILSLFCLGHSAVLSSEVVVRRMDDLPGKLVKWAHILYSGKSYTDFLNVISKFVDQHFRYRVVLEIMPEVLEWNSQARKLLLITRVARDLEPEDEEFILAADNGPWDGELMYHFCKGVRCKICHGNEKKAKDSMLKAAIMCVGRPGDTPLAYRWKGMERFTAQALRGRKYHDVWGRSANEMFPKKDTGKLPQSWPKLIDGPF